MTETGSTGASGRTGLLDRLEALATILAASSLVAVVAVQAWQVFARYVLNDSPSWTEPLALVMIAVTAMMGAAVGVRRETHFSFPTFANAAPPAVRATCQIVARLAVLVLGGGLAFYGAILMLDSFNVPMAGAPLPVGLKFAPVAIGGALIVVFALERLVMSFREAKPVAARGPDEEF